MPAVYQHTLFGPVILILFVIFPHLFCGSIDRLLEACNFILALFGVIFVFIGHIVEKCKLSYETTWI